MNFGLTIGMREGEGRTAVRLLSASGGSFASALHNPLYREAEEGERVSLPLVGNPHPAERAHLAQLADHRVDG